MSDRHQATAYSLRLPPELRALAESLAVNNGQSLNAWFVGRLETAIWINDPSRYLIAMEMITLRLKGLSPFENGVNSAYPLRMPEGLHETLAQVASTNRRSMSKEIIFRIASSMSDDEFALRSQLTDRPGVSQGVSKEILDAWARFDQAVTDLGSVQLSALPKALKRLEIERRAFGKLMTTSAEVREANQTGS